MSLTRPDQAAANEPQPIKSNHGFSKEQVKETPTQIVMYGRKSSILRNLKFIYNSRAWKKKKLT